MGRILNNDVGWLDSLGPFCVFFLSVVDNTFRDIRVSKTELFIGVSFGSLKSLLEHLPVPSLG